MNQLLIKMDQLGKRRTQIHGSFQNGPFVGTIKVFQSFDEHVDENVVTKTYRIQIWSILKIEIQIKLNARMKPNQKLPFTRSTIF